MPTTAHREQIEEFRRLVLMHSDRIASFIDQRADSKSFGCCYPTFWRSRDTAAGPIQREVNSRWQEIALALALLHEGSFPGNPFHHDASILELARAALRFWAGLQRPDGSFTKWRADGHELWPTASTTAAMAKAFKLLMPYLESDDKRLCLPAFKLAALYLKEHVDYEIPHHETAAIDALYCVHTLLPQFQFDEDARHKLENLIQIQSIEGWFPMFNGPDMGDLTLALYYLGSYFNASHEPGVEPVIEKILDFIRYFIYPDGISGGGFNTRYASVLLPTGFAILQNHFPVAHAILPYAIRNLTENLSSGVLEDNDYQCAVYQYKYIEALNQLGDSLAGQREIQHFIPAETGETFHHHCPKGQILIEKRSSYYAICSSGGSIAALFNYRTRTTQMLASANRLTAVSGLKVVDNSSLVWSSLLRFGDETWEGADGALKIKADVLPLDLAHSTRWMLPSERRSPRSLIGRSAQSILNTRLVRYLLKAGEDESAAKVTTNASTEKDESQEHFQLTRSLDFHEHSIGVVNIVKQKTKDRDFQKAAVCECLYIPPYRDEERYFMRAGDRDLTLSQLRQGLDLSADTLLVYFGGSLEWAIDLDGERPITLTWIKADNQRDNVLRYLNGSSLLLEIDILEELKGEWMARVDYRISLESRRTSRQQIVKT